MRTIGVFSKHGSTQVFVTLTVDELDGVVRCIDITESEFGSDDELRALMTGFKEAMNAGRDAQSANRGEARS